MVYSPGAQPYHCACGSFGLSSQRKNISSNMQKQDVMINLKEKYSFMRLGIVLAAVSVILFSAGKPAVIQETFNIDTKNSSIEWTGAKVTGQHHGTIKLSSGTLLFNGNTLQGGAFSADMNSLVVTDLEGESAQKLIGHLKSDDFFGVAKYPESTFRITRVSTTTGGQVTITGNLTIKGITKPLTFPAVVKRQGNAVVAVAKGVKVDRTLYNIRYNSKSFFGSIGDKAIDDEFTLSINLAGKK